MLTKPSLRILGRCIWAFMPVRKPHHLKTNNQRMQKMKITNHRRRLGLALAILTGWCMVAQETPPAAPNSNPAPPPSAPPRRSAAELEKLAEPIALHPDPLIAVILPASA